MASFNHIQHHLTISAGLSERLRKKLQTFIEAMPAKEQRLMKLIMRRSEHPLVKGDFVHPRDLEFSVGALHYMVTIEYGGRGPETDAMIARFEARVTQFIKSLLVDEAVLLLAAFRPAFHVSNLTKKNRLIKVKAGTISIEMDMRSFAGPPMQHKM